MTEKMSIFITTAMWSIIILIAIAAILTAIGLTHGDPNGWFAKQAMNFLIGDMGLAALGIFKTMADKRRVSLYNVKFHRSKNAPRLKRELCYARTYQYKSGKQKEVKVQMEVAHGQEGSWSCKIFLDAVGEKTVEIYLIDDRGNTWESQPFYPYVNSVPVFRKVK